MKYLLYAKRIKRSETIMFRRKLTSVLVLTMILLSLFQPLAFTEDQAAGKTVQIQRETPSPRLDTPMDAPSHRMATMARSSGETYITYDVAGSKKVKFKVDSGYDLDQYLFIESSPINFSIDLQGFKPDPSKPTRVTLRVYDVDQNGASGIPPEVDRVYVNGTYLGNLTGADSQWSTVTFSIPTGVLNSGENKFEVSIDAHNAGWAVEVDWAEIEIPFNIAQIEASVKDSIKIKRGNTDDIITNPIWKTQFDAIGNVLPNANPNDPIADGIHGGWFDWGARKFKYEYTIGCWPGNNQPLWKPKIKYSWKVLGSTENSGGFQEQTGWSNSFDVILPDKVGKYTLQVVLQIYHENQLLRSEYRLHTLYVLLGDPVSSISGVNTTTPKTAWLDISTEWAKGLNKEEDILKAINDKEYQNPLGWKYGYPHNDALTLVENGLGKNGDCYQFRDVWRMLAGTLGIKTSRTEYFNKLFLTGTHPALDKNESANAFRKGYSTADRWCFISHAYGEWNGTFYDPTFGVTGPNTTEGKESYIYAKYDDFDTQNIIYVLKTLGSAPKTILTEISSDTVNGWNKAIYKEVASSSASAPIMPKTVMEAVPARSMALNASAQAGAFTGSFNDSIVDEDNNNLADYLKIDIEVNVDEAGSYTLLPFLCSSTGDFIALGSLDLANGANIPSLNTELSAGKQTVSVYFDGRAIKDAAFDGSYTVWVQLYDSEGVELGSMDFQTSSYKASDFQGVLLESTSITDCGTDNNGDGLYDELTVSVDLIAAAPGNYTVEGMLFSEDTFLGNASVKTSLNTGSQKVTLSFDGTTLWNKGKNGPYTLYLSLQDIKYSTQVKYSTKAYSYTDFQKPNAFFTGHTNDIGIDTDSNGIYEELQVSAEVVAGVPGTYTLHGILQDSTGNYISSSDTTVALGNTAATLSLSFSGKQVFNSKLNGPYQAALVLIDEKGKELTSILHNTNEYSHTSFDAPSAVFDMSFSDHGEDYNADGLYDALAVNVGVHAHESGTYTVIGSLHDMSGEFIATTQTEIYFSQGSQSVTLYFDGSVIRNHGVNGPYRLFALELVQNDSNSIDSVIDPYQTNSYAYTDFQSSTQITADTFTDYGLDFNQNGLYDVLVVEADVFIPYTDYYSFNARLVDINGEEIVWASGGEYLYQGMQKISLQYDGRYIYGNSVDGPYYVKDLTIYSSSQTFYTMDAYSTNNYQYGQFEPCSTVIGMVTASGKPVPNANIFINGVDSDLTDSNGIYKLKIFSAGTYEINIDADPALGPWEIRVNGELVTTGYSIFIEVAASYPLVINFVSTAHLQEPPILDPIGSKSVREGETLQFTVHAFDPEGEAVTYQIYNKPTGASFDSASGTFTWTPDYSQAGTYPNIIIEASDGNQTATEIICITVYNTNIAPQLDPIGNITVKENQTISIKLSAVDFDGDTVKYAASNLPSGAVFDASTNTFTWTPGFTQAGNYTGIHFEVTDGNLRDFEEITISVIDVQPSQLITGLANYIKSLQLKKGLENSLLNTLYTAKRFIGKEQIEQALTQMKIFVIKVKALQYKDDKLDKAMNDLKDLMDRIGKKMNNKLANDSINRLQKILFDQAFKESKKVLSQYESQSGKALTDEEAEYLLKCAEDILFTIKLIQ